MSLLVLTMAAVAAASAGYFAARRMRKQIDEATDQENALAAPASPYSGLPVMLGDVVSANGEDRWLSGAAIAREGERRVAVVFFAPEGAAYDAVSVLPPPNRSIGWLSPVELTCPSEPPASIELSGTVYSRRARWPVSFECVGQGVPSLGPTGFVATYDAGERAVALVLTSDGRTVALHGRRYDEGEYDCLGGGAGD
jgi:hypothetical protein